jgi:hypothetical protein
MILSYAEEVTYTSRANGKRSSAMVSVSGRKGGTLSRTGVTTVWRILMPVQVTSFKKEI